MTLTVQVKSFIQHVFRLVSELMLIPIITWLSGRDKNTVERHSKSVELEDEACTTLMIDGSDATPPATAEEDPKAQARRRRREKRLSTAKEVPRLLLTSESIRMFGGLSANITEDEESIMIMNESPGTADSVPEHNDTLDAHPPRLDRENTEHRIKEGNETPSTNHVSSVKEPGMLRQIIQAVDAALGDACAGSATTSFQSTFDISHTSLGIRGSFSSSLATAATSDRSYRVSYRVSQVVFNPNPERHSGCVFYATLHINLPSSARSVGSMESINQEFEVPIRATCGTSQDKVYSVELSLRERETWARHSGEVSSAMKWVQQKIRGNIKKGLDVDVTIRLPSKTGNVKVHEEVSQRHTSPNKRKDGDAAATAKNAKTLARRSSLANITRRCSGMINMPKQKLRIGRKSLSERISRKGARTA